MTGFRPFFVISCTLIALAATPFGAPAADTSLEAVFARIDRVAAGFKGLTAEMKRLHHVELVNANEIDEGNVVFIAPDDGWKYLSSGVYTKPIEELESVIENAAFW